MRRRHVPNETAALKCRYLTIMTLDPTGQGRPRTKPALNGFAVTFSVRLPTTETY